MGVVKFCVGAFLLITVFREATQAAVYENNPFLSIVVPPVSNVANIASATADKIKQHIQQVGVVPSLGLYSHNPQSNIPTYNNYYPVTDTRVPPFNPHNPFPFFNSQQPHIGVTQPPAPTTTNIPTLNPHNPFFNHQQPHIGVSHPPAPTTTKAPTLNPHNPFFNPQQPHVAVTHPPAPTSTNAPTLNPHNPFFNPQQPHIGVTPPPAPTTTNSPTLNPHNPFFKPQQPSVGVTSPPPPTTTKIPSLNPHNPFLNPHQPSVGVTHAPLPPAQQPAAPVNPPTQPLQVPQPQSAGDLRRSCLQARGQFPSGKCNTFVNCWEDLAVEQFCPVGLAFNPAGFCDYAYNVDCVGKPYGAIPAPVAPTPDVSVPTIPPNNYITLQTSKPLVGNVLATTPIPPSYLPSGSVPDHNLKKKCVDARGFFASDHCHRYVNCWDGNAVEQECPPGLLFSSKGYCDFAHNVNCYNRILLASTVPPAYSTPPTNLPPQSGTIPTHPTYRPPINGSTEPSYAPLGDLTDPRLRKKCLGERGLFPSDYCHKFVNCWDKFAVEQECPAGLFFSDKGYCDYAYNVNCGKRIVITIPVSQPPASPTPPTNLSPDGLKPKPPQTQGPPTYRPPLDGLLTFPTTKKPLEPVTATLPPYVPSVGPAHNKLNKKCLQPRGQFPSHFCNKYVNCWDGYAVEQECLPGLLFSEKGYCDYAYNVNCNNRTTAPLSPPTGPPFNGLPNPDLDKYSTIPPYQPIITQAPPVIQPPVQPAVQPVNPAVQRKCAGLRGQFPSESCHKYIDCWDHVAVEHDCPPGLLFSEKGYCDFAYNVNCNNRTVSKAVPSSLCPSPHGTFRDRSNCSRYFTCIDNSIAVKYECPAGLSFNDVIGVCDYAYRVDCNREPFIYQPLKNGDFLQQVPASLLDATKDCRTGKVLKLSPECASVALCRSTVTEIVHCPVGLAYDAPSDRCLHPQLAKCQDS